MKPEDQPRQPSKRGRPASGVDRKEQVRRAVQKHRRKAKLGEGGMLQIELPVYLLFELKAISKRDGITLRELATRMLESGWRADYVARAADHREKAVLEKDAEGLIAKWRQEFEASFRPSGASMED